MDRIRYTFEQAVGQHGIDAQAEKKGVLDLTIRSDKVKDFSKTMVRAIRAYDDALIFEGNSDSTGHLRVALPVRDHKSSEAYTITINFGSFPTRIVGNVAIRSGQTTSKTVQIG